MKRKFNIAIVLLFLLVIMIGFSLINELGVIKNLVINKKTLHSDFLGGIQLKSILAIVIVLIMMLLVLARDYFNKRYILSEEEKKLPTAEDIKQKLKDELNRKETLKRAFCKSKMEYFESKYNSELTDADLMKLVVKTLEVCSGILFYLDKDNQLKVSAAYAVSSEDYQVKKDVADKDSLIFKAILDANISFINDLPDGYIKVKSGLGEANPKSVLFIPFQNNEGTKMVFELALLKNANEEYLDLIKEVYNKLNENKSNKQNDV